MKRFIPLILVLFFSPGLFSQSEDTLSLKLRKTRSITLEEVYTIDSTHSINESPLLKAFEGAGVEPVKEAYKLNSLAVDSILAADSLNPNFWRVYGYRATHLFIQANESPKMAMAIFLPWFLVVFVIVVLVLFVKTFFIHTHLLAAEKPKNDAISTVDEQEDEKPQINEGEEAGQNN